jgi:hypothetical protein
VSFSLHPEFYSSLFPSQDGRILTRASRHFARFAVPTVPTALPGNESFASFYTASMSASILTTSSTRRKNSSRLKIPTVILIFSVRFCRSVALVLANRGCHRFGSYLKNSRFFAIFFIGLLFGEYIPRTVEIAEGSFRLGVLRSSLLHRLEGGAEKPWVWSLENNYVVFDIQTCSVFRSHGSNILVSPGTLDAHLRKSHIRNSAESRTEEI